MLVVLRVARRRARTDPRLGLSASRFASSPSARARPSSRLAADHELCAALDWTVRSAAQAEPDEDPASHRPTKSGVDEVARPSQPLPCSLCYLSSSSVCSSSALPASSTIPPACRPPRPPRPRPARRRQVRLPRRTRSTAQRGPTSACPSRFSQVSSERARAPCSSTS